MGAPDTDIRAAAIEILRKRIEAGTATSETCANSHVDVFHKQI